MLLVIGPGEPGYFATFGWALGSVRCFWNAVTVVVMAVLSCGFGQQRVRQAPMGSGAGLRQPAIENRTDAAEFTAPRAVSHGLGPSYNATRCAACHSQPTVGGIGNMSVLHAGIVRDGHYVAPPGGDIVHLHSTGDHSCQARIPKDARNRARRIPTPLFGAGLIEAIPDSVIRTWEDPNDRDGDGIRGRAAMIMDPATAGLDGRHSKPRFLRSRAQRCETKSA